MSRSHTWRVFGARVVELGKSPVYEPQLALSGEKTVTFSRCIAYLAAFTIEHDVAWLHISMHDTTGMRKVQCLVVGMSWIATYVSGNIP